MRLTIPAVVVGACAHSLAITRSLARAGVEVHVLESDANQPGLLSRYGHVHLADDINGEGLIRNLLALRQTASPGERPVLYLTNDQMVRTVATHIDELAPHYRLSWAPAAQVVAELLDKTSIEAHCVRVGLHYPKTRYIDTLADLVRAKTELRWPWIIKPARPLSGFKVVLVETPAAAREFLASHSEDLPVLAQEWIVGGDECLYFSASYYDRGAPLAHFGGRKLRSHPMGHTTVGEPYFNDDAQRCAAAFFADTGISGFASLELKKDPDGQLWVIEPTVGRTDFWIDLCIQNGVNFPLIKYLHQTGQAVPKLAQLDRVAWLNAQRDPAAPLWYVAHLGLATRYFRHLRFTYFDVDDLRPFLCALLIDAKYIVGSVTRRGRKFLNLANGAT